MSAFAVLACVRGDRDQSPAPSATPAAPAPGAPSAATGQPAPITPPAAPVAAPTPSPQPKGEPGTSTACNTDADCRTFSDSCGICSCRPFAKSSPDPKCPTKPTTCLIDPCTGQRVHCRKGTCMLGDPGDAALTGATPASTKDAAASVDAAGKGAGSASPAASTAPKSTDAARD